MDVRIFVEGGGDQKSSRRDCRLGFTDLFSEYTLLAEKARVSLRFVASGSRNSAFDDFCISLKAGDPSTRISLLLVDQEAPLPVVQPGERHPKWRHVKEHDHWSRPTGVGEGHLNFMTMCVESWIVADQENLRRFYGNAFNSKQLPQSDIEERSPAGIIDALKRASIKCDKSYVKRHAFALTGSTNLAIVRGLSSGAAFCKTLDSIIGHGRVI